MNITIKVDKNDIKEVLDLLDRFPSASRRSAISAMRSVGYNIQQDLKKEGLAGSRSKWPRRSPFTVALNRASKTKDIDTKYYKKGYRKGWVKPKRSTSRNPMPNLIKTPRYSLDQNMATGSLKLKVGLLNNVESKLVDYNENKSRIKVTDKMRRFFFASGVPIKNTTKWIEVPARKWFPPIEAKWDSAKVAGLFADKFFASMGRKGINL